MTKELVSSLDTEERGKKFPKDLYSQSGLHTETGFCICMGQIPPQIKN